MALNLTKEDEDNHRMRIIQTLIRKFEHELDPPYVKTAQKLHSLEKMVTFDRTTLLELDVVFIEELKNELLNGLGTQATVDRIVDKISVLVEKERKPDKIHVSQRLNQKIIEWSNGLNVQKYVDYVMQQIPDLKDENLRYTMAASLYFFTYEYLINEIPNAQRVLPERKIKIRNAIAHNSIYIIKGGIKFDYLKPNSKRIKLPIFNQEIDIVYYPDINRRWVISGSSNPLTIDEFLREGYENYLYFTVFIRWLSLLTVIQRIAQLKRLA